MRKAQFWLVTLLAPLCGAPAWAQDTAGAGTPRWEVAIGYSYIRANLLRADGCCFPMNGASGSLAYNFNDWFGLAADFGIYLRDNVRGTTFDLTIFSYMAGPRFSYRKDDRYTPFAQLLVGGGHAGGSLYTQPVVSSQPLGAHHAFALALGGGVDIRVTDRFALRVVQTEYFFTRFRNGRNDRQNNLRVTAGFVFRFGQRD